MYVKQEVNAEGKADAVDCEVHSDDDTHFEDADWEPGTWCWVLDDAHNWNSAPEGAVKLEDEEAVTKEEERRRKKTKVDKNNVASTSQLVSSFSSSRSIKEDTKENNNNNKLLRREDEEEKENGACKSEQNEGAVLSAPQFVASSFQLGNSEVQSHKLRHDNNSTNSNNDDDDNNHKIRHSTDRSVKTNIESEHDGRSDNTITNNSNIGTNYPDPCDDTWRAGI